MDIDLTGLWTWTLPLWGLAALVFFLVSVMVSPAEILTRTPAPLELAGMLHLAPPAAGAGMGGGARRKRSH
jgi:hypothetical protein